MHCKILDLLFELGAGADAELAAVSSTECTALAEDWLLWCNPAL